MTLKPPKFRNVKKVSKKKKSLTLNRKKESES